MARAFSFFRARPVIQRITALLFFTLICLYYFGGISSVPFHPDESSYIFMSSDFSRFITQPSSLFWQPEAVNNLPQHYREIDAPLTRYFIGAGLAIANLKPITQDWNWSASWSENAANGALPSQDVLLVGRISVAWVFPLTLTLMFLIGKKLGGTVFGVITSILFAANALVLLHTRRSMEESLLIFGISLTVWGVLNIDRNLWMAVVGSIISVNSKQSALALVPVVMFAILWLPAMVLPFKKRIRDVVLYLVIFICITFLLNPFLWNNPIQAAKEAVESRLALVHSQASEFQSISPQSVIDTPGERLVALVAQLYIAPPAIQDVGNYSDLLTPMAKQYFQIPGTNLYQGFVFGGIFFFLTLLGISAIILDLRKHGITQCSLWFLFLTAFTIQLLVLIFIIPLPFQRYWMPLLPFVIVLAIKGALWVLVFPSKVIQAANKV